VTSDFAVDIILVSVEPTLRNLDRQENSQKALSRSVARSALFATYIWAQRSGSNELQKLESPGGMDSCNLLIELTIRMQFRWPMDRLLVDTSEDSQETSASPMSCVIVIRAIRNNP
jgi:hypothetical protein